MSDDAPTFGSVFSGIGGFDLGLERAGWRCLFQIEIDGFCRRVLDARWPSIPRHGDVRAVAVTSEAGEQQLERPDLLCGGFPCQDLSVAGKRGGLKAARSGLFFEFARLASELRPRWLLIENVPGLYSSNLGDDFGRLLAELDERGFDAEWATLDSRWFGVPQRRRRVFIIGHLRDAGDCPFPLLTESEGGSGNPPAVREEGAGVAASLTGGSHRPGVSYPGRHKEDDENIVMTALRHLGSGGPDDNEAQGGHLIVAHPLQAGRTVADSYGDQGNIVAHPLSSEGADASEDGTGRGTPLVWPIQEVSGRQNKAQHGEGGGLSDQDVMYTLQSAHQHGVGIAQNQRGEVLETDYAHQLTGGGGKPGEGYPAARVGAQVRRLTPTECERLQGFPDGFTCLEEWTEDRPYSTTACKCPDSPRYRALGNAVTVPVVVWIGQRLMGILR